MANPFKEDRDFSVGPTVWPPPVDWNALEISIVSIKMHEIQGISWDVDMVENAAVLGHHWSRWGGDRRSEEIPSEPTESYPQKSDKLC